jgi:hypothetical protein
MHGSRLWTGRGGVVSHCLEWISSFCEFTLAAQCWLSECGQRCAPLHRYVAVLCCRCAAEYVHAGCVTVVDVPAVDMHPARIQNEGILPVRWLT